jgi:hypothetical protein
LLSLSSLLSLTEALTLKNVRFLIIIIGVTLSALDTVATTGLLYHPHMIFGGDFGAIGGMKIGRGNRRTQRKPAPVPLCPPQIHMS